MTLVWHIVRKDLRRFAVPLLVWVLFVAGPTIGRLVTPNVEGHAAASIGMMIGGLKIWIQGMNAVIALLGYLLAGSLVFEDSIVGSTEFWKTRPIARGRLLAAKVIAAACMLIGAPLALLTVAWLANGFGPGELAAAAGGFAAGQARIALLALAIASLSRSLAQFVFFTLLLVYVGGMVCVGLPALLTDAATGRVQASRDLVALGMIPVVAAVVVWLQFLLQRRRQAWMVIGVALAACFVIRVAWPWDVVSGPMAARHRARFQERPEDRAAQVVLEPTFRKSRPDSNELPNLFGTSAWAAAGFYAPTFLKTHDTAYYAMWSSGVWESEAGLRLLGFKAGPEPLRCQLAAAQWTSRAHASLTPDNPQFSGLLEIWYVRPRIIGEAPLREGAHFRSEANHTRVLHLERHSEDNRLDAIFVEESTSHAAYERGWRNGWTPGDGQSGVYIDCYFLVNRVQRQAQALPANDLGSIELNAVVVYFRRLHVAGEGDWRDGTLVKVRFECDHRFERPLEVRGISYGRPWSQL